MNKGRLVKLHVGWFHKAGEKYTQMKRPRGGIRVLEITDTEAITVPVLINLMKEVFFRNTSLPVLGYSEDDLKFNLGKYDGNIIKQFEDDKGNICDLFEYMKCYGLIPSKFNLYLLTELNVREPKKPDLVSEAKKNSKDTLEVGSSPCLMQGLNKFDVQYLQMTKSIYSNEPILSILCSEKSCIDLITSKEPEIQWSSEQSILNFDFQICNI